MTLRSKILITLLFVVVLYAAMDYGIHRLVIFPSYISLERAEAQKDMERCVEALRDEIHHLDVFTNDWATWDDTYHFVQHRNNSFIVSNLGIQTFLDNNLNIIYFCNTKGEVIWGEMRDLESGQKLRVPEFPSQVWPQNHLLLQHRTVDSAIAGIYETARGPIMVASRPIITSERKGPVQGSLIMGRFMSDDLKAAFAEQTRVDLHLFPVNGDSVQPAEREILHQITADAPYFIAETKQLLNIYTTFPDIYGAPGLLLRADIPRNITAAGSVTMRFAVISTLIVGVILLIVLLVLLQRIVIKPVSDLTRHAVRIHKHNDLSLRYVTEHADEIGILAEEFNRMVSQLDAVQQGLETLVAERTSDLEAVNRRLKQENADRRRAEEALRQARDDLERQVDARTAELVKANSQLKREIEERRLAENELSIYHQKLRSLSSELILTEERERRRIATDLHDRIGQALTISKIKLDALVESASPPDLSINLAKISELIDQTIQDARRLTFELSPPVLYELGLEAALEWLAEKIQEHHGLAVAFEDDMQPKPLDNVIRVLIFQAGREVLFNVVKHAQAQKVTVSIQRKGDMVQIDIQDDGIGFNTSTISYHSNKSVGFGLFSIRERLRHLGGSLEVDSAVGKGTRVTLVSPLKQFEKI